MACTHLSFLRPLYSSDSPSLLLSDFLYFLCFVFLFIFFFFQAEDGIRDLTVTGVQTCALPIWIGEPVVQRRAVSPLPDFEFLDRGVKIDEGDLKADHQAGRLEDHCSEVFA